MSVRVRMTLAVALAVALGSAALAPLYLDRMWLARALGAVAAVAVAGLLCRQTRVPTLLQPLVALAFLVEFVCLAFVQAKLSYDVLPNGRAYAALGALLEEGLTDIERLGPPVPSHPGLVLIATLGLGAVALAVDVLAVLVGRAAVAGLPLLALFAIPAGLTAGGLGWLPFTLTAVGWLILLLVEGGDRVSRWGAPLKGPARVSAYDDATLGRVGRRIGAAALGIAVVVPALIPGLDARLLANGSGSGTGEGGSRTTTTYNPITRLRADLRLPSPRPILTYTTDDPAPDYLRLTTLDRFSDGGWAASKLTGSTRRDGVKDDLPAPIGLSTSAVREVNTRITITGLDAQWLPAPFPPRVVDVQGPWLFDSRSETIFGIRTGTQKLDEPYRVTATRVLPDRATLAAAGRGLPQEIRPYTALPGVTPFVAQLTAQIVAGQATAYDRVAALQAYFRDPKSRFRYDTSSRVAGIDGPSALEDFLRGKRGFCEQYASAMAAMIRQAGVPARVAVGFTPGARQEDGSLLVTTDNAHAWPEAWFAGAGWVRFEPTPRRDGQTAIPSYALPADADPALSAPTGPELPEPEASGDPATDGSSGDTGRLEPEGGAGATAGTESGSGGARVPVLALVALIGALAVAATPWLLHALRRRARWRHGGDALVAWRQVEDDAVDVGHAWLPVDSPRTAARRLAQERSLDGPATAALDRLAAATERVRYARPSAGHVSDGLHDDASAVRAGLLAGAGRRTRLRAQLLPMSTVRWAAATAGTRVADALDGFDTGWAAVRRRLYLASLTRLRTRQG